MTNLNFSGRNNIIQPALYIPNRLSIEAGKTLHHELDGKVCYLVDPTYPPDERLLQYAQSKGVHIEYFDFRKTTPRLVREQIKDQLNDGKNVVFVPGKVAKNKSGISDLPAPFLRELSNLHISPVPVFLGHYGETPDTLFDDTDSAARQELCILPQLPPGPRAGERVLFSWLNKSAELFADHPLLCGSLTSMLVRSLKAHPKTELIDGVTGERTPFLRLLGIAMAVATHLRDLRVRRIGVVLPPGPPGVIATLACLLAGITPVMINYGSSRAAFKSTVRQAELKVFVTARAFMQKLPNFPWPAKEQMILVEDLMEKIGKLTLARNVLMAKMTPAALLCKLFDTDAHKNNEEAVLLFTSGSSGEPKGVQLSHRMVITNAAQCACRLDMSEADTFLSSLPIFHSFGLTLTMFTPLLIGIPFCTYPSPTDARNLCELVKKYRLTILAATPTFARAMLRRAEDDTFASVRHFIVGAEKLTDDLEQEFLSRFGLQLMEGYGLTECSPICTVNIRNAPPVEGSNFYIPGHVQHSIGALLPGLAVRVTHLDDDERELPITETGMLWFKGSNVFGGYLGKPELNDEIFHDGWFKSGDIGRVDLNGFIYLGGRLSRFSKVGGEMVPHIGVEQAITEALGLNPSVDGLMIAITGVNDAKKGEALVLLSALPQHQRTSEEKEHLAKIRDAFIAADIPNLWAPRYIVPVESIPILSTGKLDLRSCKLLAEEALGGCI